LLPIIKFLKRFLAILCNSQNKAWNPTFRDIWILNQVISKEI